MTVGSEKSDLGLSVGVLLGMTDELLVSVGYQLSDQLISWDRKPLALILDYWVWPTPPGETKTLLSGRAKSTFQNQGQMPQLSLGSVHTDIA